MYKLIITGFLVAIFAVVAAAQPTPRKGAEPAAAPAKTTAKTRTAPSGSTDKARQPAASSRENTNAATRATQSRSTAKSSATTEKGTLRVSATPAVERPAANSSSGRTIPGAMPAAPTVDEAAPQIRWMTIEEAMERSKTEKRKLFIDVYTQWCGWCKRMDQTTFTNRDVVKYINQHYYPVKFDAEQEKEIVFRDKTYRFKRNGARGYHELAAEWLGNRLSYPTVVFLDENLNVIQPLSGYLEPLKLETILNYFGTDSHKTTPWETYEKRFGQR